MSDQETQDFGPAAVHLLRGILYRDRADIWSLLLRHRGRVETYFDALRLDLYVDEAEGFAYLRQREDAEGEDFPRLMSRRNLTYPQTILLVLLRKRLLEFESAGNETRLVLSSQDMVEMMRIYWDELDTNERKREDQVMSSIQKLVKFKFLQPLKSERDRYEVGRIIKAYLPIEELAAVLQKMRRYAREKAGVFITDNEGTENEQADA